MRGNPRALVTIVEFSDFECPFCKRVQPTLEALRARYAKAFATYPENKAHLKNRMAVGGTVIDHEQLALMIEAEADNLQRCVDDLAQVGDLFAVMFDGPNFARGKISVHECVLQLG